MSPRLRPRLLQLIVGLLIATALVSPSAAQESIKDARQKRDSAVNAQANAAAQINFLKAQDADVAEAVEQVNVAVTTQQARVEAAQQGITSAEQEAAAQNALVAEAQVQITGVRAQVGELLVLDYMGRTAEDATAILRAGSLIEGLQKAALLDAVSTDRRRLTSSLRGLQADLDTALRAANDAVERAQHYRSELAAELEALQGRLADQQRLKGELERRIVEWRKKQDQLARDSANLSSFILKEQARILGVDAGAPAAASVQGFILPLRGKIGSGFGMRRHPIYGDTRMHTGTDIDGRTGDPVVAAKEGRVILASVFGGYGNCVIIQNGGVSTLYAHLSSIDVSVGNNVNKGEFIGRVGSTGVSTGPHLHFEVRINGSPKDPMLFLP
ncbi:MAG TPA: peptidoglycan DD-metalloendopeptidase family protein [Acidimicrobiales bacterium]|nr:peptidoglycan DD-metalloendopeptidase family protein [Acidimicrobiales bacterium]